jgi:hypothetical protein
MVEGHRGRSLHGLVEPGAWKATVRLKPPSARPKVETHGQSAVGGVARQNLAESLIVLR